MRPAFASEASEAAEDADVDPEYYGLVEIGFTGLVALGFAAYQLWTVRSPRPRTPPQERRPERDEAASRGDRAAPSEPGRPAD
ncbi:MAG: hypothetical protein U0900_04315 [Myxococcota bacterium]